MTRKRLGRGKLSAIVVFVLTSCSLVACGYVGQHRDVKLGVPFREQAPETLDCKPASVLMWRLYDGLPEMSQATIGAWMGGGYTGYSPEDIADAVNHFTHTWDVYVDRVGEVDHEQFFSRQITSLDRRTPVIAIINGTHAGVVNGGKWRTLASGGYEWDYVYFHDPNSVANDYYPSGDWLFVSCASDYETCIQIVSSSGVVGWQSNSATYGPHVRLYGFFCPNGPDLPICP